MTNGLKIALTVGIVAGTAMLIAVATKAFHKSDNAPLQWQSFAMDSPVSVKLEGAGQGILDEIKRTISELSTSLTVYDDSELSRLNKNGSATLLDNTAELISQATELCRLYPQTDITSGALTLLWDVAGENPHVPTDAEIADAVKTIGIEKLWQNGREVTLENGTQLDLGCCAKGFALDKLYKLLAGNAERAVVSFGSSTLLYGTDKPFTVGVRNPNSDNPNDLAMTFELSSGFVSTSGGYERYFVADGEKLSHIFDLATGFPAQTDLTSVTVIADSGILSDFMSTVIFLGKTDGLADFLSSEEFSVIAVTDKNVVYASANIVGKISLYDGFFLAENP